MAAGNFTCTECGAALEYLSSIPDLMGGGGLHAFKCKRCGKLRWVRYGRDPPPEISN